jgi:hypothetical protein
MRSKTVLAEEGRTYTDDGTTVFDVYVSAGLADGSFEAAKHGPGTIVVSHPESRKRGSRTP